MNVSKMYWEGASQSGLWMGRWMLGTSRPRGTSRYLSDDDSRRKGLYFVWFLPTAGRKFSKRILEGNPYIAFDHERKGVARLANHFYQTFPAEPWYGFICDDMVPRTDHWHTELAYAAGNDRIAICDDLGVPQFYSNKLRCGSCFVLGGDLVRAAGFFLPPWCTQRGVDTVWNRLARKFDLFKYREDVIVENLYVGKRPFDDIDALSTGAQSHADPVKQSGQLELIFHNRVADRCGFG